MIFALARRPSRFLLLVQQNVSCFSELASQQPIQVLHILSIKVSQWLVARSCFIFHVCYAASYGSTKRYKSVQRLVKVNESTVLGAGGEISDLQFILNMLDDLRTEDYCADDGQSLSSQELYSYLSRVMYNRRNKCVHFSMAVPCALHIQGPVP